MKSIMSADWWNVELSVTHPRSSRRATMGTEQSSQVLLNTNYFYILASANLKLVVPLDSFLLTSSPKDTRSISVFSEEDDPLYFRTECRGSRRHSSLLSWSYSGSLALQHKFKVARSIYLVFEDENCNVGQH